MVVERKLVHRLLDDLLPFPFYEKRVKNVKLVKNVLNISGGLAFVPVRHLAQGPPASWSIIWGPLCFL
jgi:hypothetical protein